MRKQQEMDTIGTWAAFFIVENYCLTGLVYEAPVCWTVRSLRLALLHEEVQSAYFSAALYFFSKASLNQATV